MPLNMTNWSLKGWLGGVNLGIRSFKQIPTAKVKKNPREEVKLF